MKTVIVILSLGIVSWIKYNEEREVQIHATLSSPRINILHLQYVTGYSYLKPKFVYEFPGEEQTKASGTKASTKTTGVVPSSSIFNKLKPFPWGIKWYSRDLNNTFIKNIKLKGEGC